MIPPGRAGLIVLAFAMVPIVVKEFKPIVRWVGKRMRKFGETIEGCVDEVNRYDSERQEKRSSQETKAATTAEPAAAAQATAAKPKKAPSEKKTSSKGVAPKKMTGATPPKNNAKRSRAKPPGAGGADQS